MAAAAPRQPPLPMVVLISGHGSNLQAILDRIASGRLNAVVRAVVSDRPHAPGLGRATAASVATHVLEPRTGQDRDAYDAALANLVDRYSPGLVVLAGFMRRLGKTFVERFTGRLLNIHPSLLPAYPGLHTHRRVLEAGERIHGCSVHFVTEELDGGPVIAQAHVPVYPGDTPERLRERVQAREHRLYPEVIGWFAAGRVSLRGRDIMIDGHPQPGPRIVSWEQGEPG